MIFSPFVYNTSQERISVDISPMTAEDAHRTNVIPAWQTDWESDYILSDRFEKYAVKYGSELLALGAYEILNNSLVVHIVYMEAQPESNPTMTNRKKYFGIGRLLIAYGIKLSIDNGLTGDVVLEAKTTQLAKHYEKDFGAVALPSFGSAPRYLIADEAAKRIFFTYLTKGGDFDA
ncbi:MAG: hypothetical protein Q4E35_00165 [Eubacteriales bacterium]|nr:hypothetical protein [Eubacteriales bacterium]